MCVACLRQGGRLCPPVTRCHHWLLVITMVTHHYQRLLASACRVSHSRSGCSWGSG